MNTTPRIPTGRERALVLGGGGSAGNAWLIGVVAGLHEGGLDVTEADLVVGTSAGATAAAQLGGASPADLLAAILEAPTPSSSAGRRGPGPITSTHLERTNAIIAASADLADMRRRAGAYAIELATASGPAGQQQWRETVAARLPSARWPERTVLLTTVDADTGEPVELDRDSGVDLVDAVAASCAGGPAYVIGDRRYIDGGYRRSSENADLAAGCGRVLVLSPLGGRTRHPAAWRSELAAQVDELRDGGSVVETVLPDEASLEAFGGNMMSPSTRPPAARAGRRQGLRAAEKIAEFWSR
ncbi:patatin-like phospholipase family protein [Nocardioides sp. KC13]|uniref:Patatin-like phospholipase family protein n=1 Tax=Nocardioides turkmenicus TaxID=2711220 RepID=A0A6M1R0K1_9ACTN|nr:patatin-like phospholipase family protein [Nocardioides sp. KC13]NGN93232.1 patatin-like phospholipase family protein [Nocardioides sp. KC13]